MKCKTNLAGIIKNIAEVMANVCYKSASIWHTYQPKEPKMPEKMK